MVVTSGNGLITSLTCWAALVAPSESVTVTEKMVPPAVGVPETRPEAAFNDSPAGRLPVEIAHVE